MKFTPSHGWQEVVTCVHDIGRWTEALEHIAGWSVVHRGKTDPRLLKAWQVTDGATATEAIVACREDPARWMRLIAFDGAKQQHIRSSGQPWESGGIFSILCYSRDTQAAFERAQEIGWSAHNDPVFMEFGESKLLNVVLRGPDGCNFGLYEALNSAPAQTPVFPKVGPPFNAQQMVRDIGSATAFYGDALGWHSWFAETIRMGCNNFGIPRNLIGVHPKHVAIMDARERRYAQVELIQWTGFEGRDFSDRAIPPNIGHLALRWPVEDIDHYGTLFASAGAHVFVAPMQCEMAPFGNVRICSVRTPDGTIIELVQSVS